jgi:hypothetical protein
VAVSILAVVPKGGAAPADGKWEVVVFEDESPNAFALPGGKIGVHTGMLAVATTAGQLAAVVGHEIGHVLLRHGNERLSQNAVAQSAVEGSSVAMSSMKPEARNAVVGGLGVGAEYGVLLPFSRKHENEADVVGQRFMAEAGYNPAEAVKLWQKMESLSQGQAPPQWMSTHPANATRIENLKANLGEMRLHVYAGLVEVPGHGLVDLLRLGIVEGDLGGCVAVLLLCLDLADDARAGLDDGHWNEGVVLTPDLGHPQLASQQCRDHVLSTSSRRSWALGVTPDA